MSTERDESPDRNSGHPDHTRHSEHGDGAGKPEGAAPKERPARRSRLTVVAVAAAVLLAGGGGAIWAAAADGKGGSGPEKAPILRLDGGDASADGSGGVPAVGTGGTGSGGSGDTYQLTGKLPQGPKSAAVYRAAGQVTAAQVQRLAALLGVSGPVTAEQGAWRAGGAPDGGGPALLVSKDAPGTWSYTRYGPSSDIGPAAGGPRTPGDSSASRPATGSDPGAGSSTVTSGGGPPVSEERAKAAAAPVLAGLGLSDAQVDAAQTAGAVRTVAADPVVGGLPTHGWATTLQIGSDRQLALGYGRLSPLGKGDTYPVITAAQALKKLDGTGVHPDYGIASCPVQPAPKPKPSHTSPGDDKTLPHTLPCVPGSGHRVQVRGAHFGLAMEYVSGAQALVPAWLFDTAPAGVSRTTVVAGTAVDPAFVRPAPGGGAASPSPTAPALPAPSTGPAQPGDPAARPVRVEGFRTSGDTLTVTFWGGVCSTYRAAAQESASQVRVSVTATEKQPGMKCPMIAKSVSETVRLAQPVGGRTVVDTSDGHSPAAR